MMDSIPYGVTYGLTAASVALVSIPILIVLWRVVTAPIRIWVPFLLFLGGIFLIQGASELIGPEKIIALIYILAGVGRS
jgi:hypothetical protein